MDTIKTKSDGTQSNGAKPKQTAKDEVKRRVMRVILTDEDLFRFGMAALREEYPYMDKAELVPIERPSKTNDGYVMEYELA